MNKELNLISSDITSDDITIIGITTTISGFSLAQHINTLFQTKLKLFKDFESYDKETDQIIYFKNYYYYHTPYRLNNFLISNKNNEDNILIKNNIRFDYIYMLIGRDHRRHAKTFIELINNVTNIVLIKIIHPTTSSIKKFSKKTETQQILNLFEETPQLITSRKNQKKINKEDLNLSQFLEDVDYNLGNIMFEKRIFLAYKISLNETINKQINKVINFFGFENIHPSPKENYHLTLEFIGNTSFKQMKNIIVLTQEILQKYNKTEIEIEIDKIDYFEIKKNNLVLYLGIKENPELEELNKIIREEYKKKNINFSNKSFHPHISIGKIKNLKDESKKEEVKNLFKITPQKLTITTPILFESISIDNNIRYDIVQTF